MNVWFGKQKWAPICDSGVQVKTPAQPCSWCGEGFTDDDNGVGTPGLEEDGVHLSYHHQECFLRMVLGSVGHQQHRCSCYGGTDEDPPEMTRREAARAAVAYWRLHQ